ncbi:MAG: hypothetical protein AB8F78_01655 [Saprospiraceae bacterium]
MLRWPALSTTGWVSWVLSRRLKVEHLASISIRCGNPPSTLPLLTDLFTVAEIRRLPPSIARYAAPLHDVVDFDIN